MIRQYGDVALFKKATPVTDITQEIVDLSDLMIQTMKEEHGLGVAANQLGSRHAMFVYTLQDGKVGTFINPRIVESKGLWLFREGCLSLPGMFFDITRPKQVTITATDLSGVEITMEADEIDARLFQHEMDHLSGRLVLDRITKNQKSEAIRQLKKRFRATTV